MQNGTKPTPVDHRDYDFHKTFGTVAPPSFEPDFLTDAGLWMPNQTAAEPIFGNPPLFYGCTDYTQADLVADIEGVLKNPALLEAVTHANARGGYDIRQSLEAARGVYNFGYYFNVRPQGQLDFFDTIRLAMLSGVPEKRSVSVGTPYWMDFETMPTAILPMPKSLSTVGVPWHNWKVAGWKTINGAPYLIGKSWQGQAYGEQGYVYWSRALINTVMSIPGTCAFTISEAGSNKIQRIDISLVQKILSALRNLLSFAY